MRSFFCENWKKSEGRSKKKMEIFRSEIKLRRVFEALVVQTKKARSVGGGFSGLGT